MRFSGMVLPISTTKTRLVLFTTEQQVAKNTIQLPSGSKTIYTKAINVFVLRVSICIFPPLTTKEVLTVLY